MLVTIVLRGHWLITVSLYPVMFFPGTHQIYFLLVFGIFILWACLERTNPIPWGLIAVNFLSFHSYFSLVQAGYFVAFAITIWFLHRMRDSVGALDPHWPIFGSWPAGGGHSQPAHCVGESAPHGVLGDRHYVGGRRLPL